MTNNTPPAYSSSSVNGDRLQITFDGGLATDIEVEMAVEPPCAPQKERAGMDLEL